MNCSTTRCTTPAAAPRTGRGESALPRPDPGTKTQPPFAAIPHDIAADPRLSPTDLRVLAALLYYARQDPSCYPSDASIAARVHRHPGTVRRCLKRLEDLGYIRREFVQATPANPTGRLIHLTCTEPDWPRPEMVPTPERRCTPTPERRCTPTPEHRAHPPRALMLGHPVRRRTPKENFQKKKNVTLRSFPRYANTSSLYRIAQVFLCVHLVPKPQLPAPSSRPRTALRRLKSRPVAPPRPPARPLHQAHPGPLRTSSGPSRVPPRTASGHWRGDWRTISGIPHRLGSSSWFSVWLRRARLRLSGSWPRTLPLTVRGVRLRNRGRFLYQFGQGGSCL